MSSRSQGSAAPLPSGPEGTVIASHAAEIILRSRMADDAYDRLQVTASGSILVGNGVSVPVGGSPIDLINAHKADPLAHNGTYARIIVPLGGVLDDGPAVRALAAELEAAGGGIIRMKGTFRFNSYDPTENTTDEFGLVRLGTNVSIEGESFGAATIKMVSGLSNTLPAGKRLSFIVTKPSTSRQQIRNLVFDADGFVLTVAFSSFNMVRASSTDVLCEHLYAKNLPGRNMIVTANDRMTIRDVTVINGSKNVPGNTVADDCSFVYLNGIDHVVEDCRFLNEAAPVTNCGGVEAHGSNITIRRNTFANLYPAIYTGYEGGVSIAYNQQIHSNKIDDCKGAVVFLDRHVGGSISHNHITGSGVPNGAVYCPRDAGTGVASAGVISGLDIIDNTFTATTDFASPPLVLVGWQNAKIERNTVVGYRSGVVYQSSTTPIKSNSVRYNFFIDPPGNGATSEANVNIAGDGAWSASMTDVYIEDNFATKSGAAPANTSMVMIAGTPANFVVLRVKARGNRVINMTDSCLYLGAYEAVLQYIPLDSAALIPVAARVATSESTASATYVDLTTVGPAVTFTVPASGKVLVTLAAGLYNASAYSIMGVALSGANTVAADDAFALVSGGVAGLDMALSTTLLISGLTPGITTFTAKYRTPGGTVTAKNRVIKVEGA